MSSRRGATSRRLAQLQETEHEVIMGPSVEAVEQDHASWGIRSLHRLH